MGSSSTLFSAFNRAAVVNTAARMVRIKSYSGNEAEIANFSADLLSDLGFEVEMRPFGERRCNVIGRWRGRGGGHSFMYNGHMDTNPAGEGWIRDPLAGVVDDEYVYGIGISNMKASNASIIEALSMLRRIGFEPRGDLIVAFVVGELQGGIGTVNMLESGMRADYFVVGEPTELTLLTQHSASFVFEITVLGRTRHLSKQEEGIDAIALAEKLAARLRPFIFSGAASEADLSLNRINVGVIHGGVSRELLSWRPQQVADCCVLRCAGRFASSQSLDGAMRDLQALLDELSKADPSFTAELRLVTENRIYMPPFKTDIDSLPVRIVAEAHQAATGEAARVGMHVPARFFGSDAAHLSAAGMTGLLYGAGGQFNTMPDERVSIAEMEIASKVYAATMLDITGVDKK
jgi:acetylornithine deacetylase